MRMALLTSLALTGCQPSYTLEKLATLGSNLQVLTTDETGAPTGWVSGDIAYRWTEEAGLSEIPGQLWPGAGGDCWVESEHGLSRMIDGVVQAPIVEPTWPLGAIYGGGGDRLYMTIADEGGPSIAEYHDGEWSDLAIEVGGGEPSLGLIAATAAGLAFRIGDASSGASALAWLSPGEEARVLVEDYGDIAAESRWGDDVLALLCDAPWCEGGEAVLWRLGADGAKPLIEAPPIGDRAALAAGGERVWLALGQGAPESGLWLWEGRGWERPEVAYHPAIPMLAADGEERLYVSEGGPWNHDLKVLR